VSLAASSAVPGIIRPVNVDGQLLFDGGLYHMQPGEFGGPVAIIAKLFDLPGMSWLYPDRKGDLVAHVGKPGSPVFAPLTKQDVDEMRQYGYGRAREDLSLPLRQGLIPVAA
jgi:hypothetical protein